MIILPVGCVEMENTPHKITLSRETLYSRSRKGGTAMVVKKTWVPSVTVSSWHQEDVFGSFPIIPFLPWKTLDSTPGDGWNSEENLDLKKKKKIWEGVRGGAWYLTTCFEKKGEQHTKQLKSERLYIRVFKTSFKLETRGRISSSFWQIFFPHFSSNLPCSTSPSSRTLTFSSFAPETGNVLNMHFSLNSNKRKLRNSKKSLKRKYCHVEED